MIQSIEFFVVCWILIHTTHNFFAAQLPLPLPTIDC